jgi:hypothetical protein
MIACLRRLTAFALPALLLVGCSSPGPVDRSGDFQLALTTDATEYAAGQPITVVAELTYLGDRDSVEIFGIEPPIGFGLRQLDGSIHLGPSGYPTCLPVELQRGEPLRQPFDMSATGPMPGGDANNSFYLSLFNQPLHLPAGRWEVSAKVDAGTDSGKCQGEIELQASTQITVR